MLFYILCFSFCVDKRSIGSLNVGVAYWAWLTDDREEQNELFSETLYNQLKEAAENKWRIIIPPLK